jgi:hypothetical protein
MKQELSVCGIDCGGCEHLKKGACPGCRAVSGKVFWTAHIGAPLCPIYACARKRRDGFETRLYSDCGECPDLPCAIWRNLKDPSTTEEQHQAGIRERVKRLRP